MVIRQNPMSDNMRGLQRGSLCVVAGRVAIAALAVVAIGCSSGANVTIEHPLPTPLVEKLPLRIGLYLGPEISTFVHEETIDEKSKWRLDLGESQQIMFRNLMSGMFRQMTVLDDPLGDPSLDAVLIPSIEELQISIPKQTYSTFYEVWIRYQMKLTDAEGRVLGEWPLTAYGNANARDYGFMESEREPALHKAAYEALRDAMAFFTLQFRSIPEIESWLNKALATGGATQ